MALSAACRFGSMSGLLLGPAPAPDGPVTRARELSGPPAGLWGLPGTGSLAVPCKSRGAARRQARCVAVGASSGVDNPFAAVADSMQAAQMGVAPRSSMGAQQQQGPGDPMTALLRQRIVFLGNQIDDFVADTIIAQLLLLDAQDPRKDIRLFINCSGGSLNAAMAIYDACQLVRADVSTIAMGIAASTAAIVLAGGTKGKRLAMPNTRIMIHQPLGGASGQAIDVEIQAKEIMYHKKNITGIMSTITGRPEWQVELDTDRDRYMSPIEAMEYGIIDSVIDRENIIPLQPIPDKVPPRALRLPSYSR